MAPIHLPDGAFSIQWLTFCWILAAALIMATFLLARRQIIAERLSIMATLAAASFAIFQVNAPFASGDLANYEARAERADNEEN
ncbi:MAG TPA: energy-coupling factor ABC transporter permease [Candidatus Bathyarchaeia archaeon]|nr:energy-coupling factor ABC transporter permease [Candidatus Bathyarchaeia archaeon]